MLLINFDGFEQQPFSVAVLLLQLTLDSGDKMAHAAGLQKILRRHGCYECAGCFRNPFYQIDSTLIHP